MGATSIFCEAQAVIGIVYGCLGCGVIKGFNSLCVFIFYSQLIAYKRRRGLTYKLLVICAWIGAAYIRFVACIFIGGCVFKVSDCRFCWF